MGGRDERRGWREIENGMERNRERWEGREIERGMERHTYIYIYLRR